MINGSQIDVLRDYNTTINVSDIWATAEPEVFPWETVLEICGKWDAQALTMAWSGLFLTILTMFYWMRWRKHLKDEKLVAMLDKATFTTIAMLFVIIIVRMMRAA